MYYYYIFLLLLLLLSLLLLSLLLSSLYIYWDLLLNIWTFPWRERPAWGRCWYGCKSWKGDSSREPGCEAGSQQAPNRCLDEVLHRSALASHRKLVVSCCMVLMFWTPKSSCILDGCVVCHLFWDRRPPSGMMKAEDHSGSISWRSIRMYLRCCGGRDPRVAGCSTCKNWAPDPWGWPIVCIFCASSVLERLLTFVPQIREHGMGMWYYAFDKPNVGTLGIVTNDQAPSFIPERKSGCCAVLASTCQSKQCIATIHCTLLYFSCALVWISDQSCPVFLSVFVCVFLWISVTTLRIVGMDYWLSLWTTEVNRTGSTSLTLTTSFIKVSSIL